ARSDGLDLFTFDEPAVKSDLKVQQYYGLQAALGEFPGCKDDEHKEENVCSEDATCKWDTARKRCRNRDICPSPPFRPREKPLYLDNMPAWVGVVYEATNDGNILDDEILGYIDKYEGRMLTDVNGAVNSEGVKSPWDKDWCLLAYPAAGSNATPQCGPGVSPMNLFSMNAHGRAKVKQQVQDGFSRAGPLSCMCSDQDALCSICNADGTLKGHVDGMSTISDVTTMMASWPSDVATCVATKMGAMVASASSSSASSGNLSSMCASRYSGFSSMSMGAIFSTLVDRCPEKLVYVTPLDAEDAEEHQEVGGGVSLNYASQKDQTNEKNVVLHHIYIIIGINKYNIKKRRRAHELTKIYNERAERGSVTE
ncbi:unnamed protein product, partial [Polarella glacialis]